MQITVAALNDALVIHGAKATKVATIKPEDRIYEDLGVNSTLLSVMLSDIENVYGINTSNATLESLQTYEDLLALLRMQALYKACAKIQNKFDS